MVACFMWSGMARAACCMRTRSGVVQGGARVVTARGGVDNILAAWAGQQQRQQQQTGRRAGGRDAGVRWAFCWERSSHSCSYRQACEAAPWWASGSGREMRCDGVARQR
jgi:hypothetical protein